MSTFWTENGLIKESKKACVWNWKKHFKQRTWSQHCVSSPWGFTPWIQWPKHALSNMWTTHRWEWLQRPTRWSSGLVTHDRNNDPILRMSWYSPPTSLELKKPLRWGEAPSISKKNKTSQVSLWLQLSQTLWSPEMRGTVYKKCCNFYLVELNYMKMTLDSYLERAL